MFKRVVGVVMVKNEDLYIEAVLKAMKGFCDKIIVLDTGSTDDTRMLVREQGIELIIEPNLKRTHHYIQPYVGRKGVWLFGVDGDEIYDAARLLRLRHQLEAGKYEEASQVQGWYLHATEIGSVTAKGYLGPPSHTPTKLYNMGQIPSWPVDGERTLFHPKTLKRTGEKVRALPDTWQETPLRCIHTRFLCRSTQENPDTEGARLHPEDLIGKGSKADRGDSDKRNERLMYRKGGCVEVDIWPFV